MRKRVDDSRPSLTRRVTKSTDRKLVGGLKTGLGTVETELSRNYEFERHFELGLASR